VSGATWEQGDFSGDGKVDWNDFQMLMGMGILELGKLLRLRTHLSLQHLDCLLLAGLLLLFLTGRRNKKICNPKLSS